MLARLVQQCCNVPRVDNVAVMRARHLRKASACLYAFTIDKKRACLNTAQVCRYARVALTWASFLYRIYTFVLSSNPATLLRLLPGSRYYKCN